jgi:hypothetical protein
MKQKTTLILVAVAFLSISTGLLSCGDKTAEPAKTEEAAPTQEAAAPAPAPAPAAGDTVPIDTTKAAETKPTKPGTN